MSKEKKKGEEKTKKIENDTWDGKELPLHEQILLRPDTYIGSVELEERYDWLVERDENDDAKIVYKKFTGLHGLERGACELVSNTIDNVWRSKIKSTKEIKYECKRISLTVKKDHIIVWNDGYTIPIEKHKDNPELYNHEMAFGRLLAGTNFDDEEDRFSSGKNVHNLYCWHFCKVKNDLDI